MSVRVVAVSTPSCPTTPANEPATPPRPTLVEPYQKDEPFDASSFETAAARRPDFVASNGVAFFVDVNTVRGRRVMEVRARVDGEDRVVARGALDNKGTWQITLDPSVQGNATIIAGMNSIGVNLRAMR